MNNKYMGNIGHLKTTVISLVLLCICSLSNAQNLLQKKVSIQVKNKPVAQVLKMAEKQAGFYFSYNNNILNEDSLVTLSLKNKTIEQFLLAVFGKRYLFQERGNHIIIQPAATMQGWYVSGQIIDKLTGEPIAYATVYERNQLVSTMTNEQGFFRLQLKEAQSHASISISKVSYADTLLSLPELDSRVPLKVTMEQVSYTLDSVFVSGVEQTLLAKLFLTSKQTMNSLNLNGFFAKQPFQFSLSPGLGSHGKMGAQVVNKFSLNVLGGYTAGVKGIEIGGLFNIVKQDMSYLQVGGLFNIVGGTMQGVQLGGLHNTVLDSVAGIQIGGISNHVSKVVEGIQVAGVYNQAESLSGLQLGGLCNLTIGNARGIQIGGLANRNKNFRGIQVSGLANVNAAQGKGVHIAGLINVSKNEMSGVQVAGFFNGTKILEGLQIGIVNYADSSDGYSIGIININPKGYHKLSISTSELQHVTLAYKSGNSKLYSILLAGIQVDNNHKAYSLGYGMGSDKYLGKRFLLSPEFCQSYFYTGDRNIQHFITRLQFAIKYKLTDKCMLYIGPSFSFLYRNKFSQSEGYKSDFVNGYPNIVFGKKGVGWVGWSLGLDLF